MYAAGVLAAAVMVFRSGDFCFGDAGFECFEFACFFEGYLPSILDFGFWILDSSRSPLGAALDTPAVWRDPVAIAPGSDKSLLALVSFKISGVITRVFTHITAGFEVKILSIKRSKK